MGIQFSGAEITVMLADQDDACAACACDMDARDATVSANGYIVCNDATCRRY